MLRKTILEADGRERNARIGGVSKSFPMESQRTDTMSGLKTKKLGIYWSPTVGGQFWQTGRDIKRHGWPPARPSIPIDEAEQKAGWLARADTRVPDLGSTQEPHTSIRVAAYGTGSPLASALLWGSPDGLAVRDALCWLAA